MYTYSILLPDCYWTTSLNPTKKYTYINWSS